MNWQWMCTTFLLGHWQPLTWLSIALDYAVWGLNPTGWHVTNLCLHAANAVLVYLFCLTFINGRRSGRWTGAVPALLGALFWAIHPLRVEAVGWLATRGYLLCTFFCLLTILFYLRASSSGRYPWAALLFFTLASVTKGIGMMLPAVLLLIDWSRAKESDVRLHWWFRRTVEKIPFFVFSLFTGGMAFLAKNLKGGMASVEQYGFADRFEQAFYGIWFYLFKTVSPAELAPVYYERPEAGPVMVSLVLTASLAVAFVLFRRPLKALWFSGGAFLILIFPVLGFTQSGPQITADRFTYLAAVPFSVLIAAGLVRIRKMRRVIWGAAAVLLFVFGLQTFVWAKVWSSSLLLWHHSICIYGGDPRSYNGVGQALRDVGNYEKAIAYYNAALQLNPAHISARQNRALALAEIGRGEEALKEITALLQRQGIETSDRVKMMISRGYICEQLGDIEEALQSYSDLIDSPKTDPVWRIRVLQIRAALLIKEKKMEEAEKDLQNILMLPDPSGEFHQKARLALQWIKKIPEE